MGENHFLSDYTGRIEDVLDFQDIAFPHLTNIDKDIDNHIKPVNHQDQDEYNKLRLWEIKELDSWITLCESQLLWFNLHSEDDRKLRWTTILSMDLFELNQIGDRQADEPQKDGPQRAGFSSLIHYCSGMSSLAFRGRARLVVQSLIIQLISLHRQKFSKSICEKHSLHHSRFAAASENQTKLWKIFLQCLEISQTEAVHIIIDDIDMIIPGYGTHTKKNDSQPAGSYEAEMKDFQILLGNVKALTLSPKRICKVFITNRGAHSFNLLSTPSGMLADMAKYTVLLVSDDGKRPVVHNGKGCGPIVISRK